AGDSVIQTANFVRKGGTCYVSSQGIITNEESCAGIMSKYDSYKYIAESAGVIWAENENGATKLLTQTGSNCTSTFFFDEQQKSR
ncbi:TPA: hypothetical protein MB324_002138, partial [Klebsiella pneumoniae]|nr:hypothetical protein [Klebsiella pneumoniae]